MEHFFTTFVRTKTVFKHRLKDLKDYGTVKVYMYELKKLSISAPVLYQLRLDGEIWYDKKGNFKALRQGPIDPSLLERARKRSKVRMPLTSLHVYMMRQLLYVELGVPRSELPVYFKAFLDMRGTQLGEFFTVDSFCGRVHTPVVNLKGDLRGKLTFYGGPVSSLDVKQMQPTILAKVLLQSVGKNSFSDAIFRGEDVYVLLQKEASLPARSDAKKLLFQLIFGKPMGRIGDMFKGDNGWVEWINAYKSKEESRNPHKQDKHTNLAWLLQFSEVQVMSGMWEKLMRAGIPFLTIHDDILVRRCDKDVVYAIMVAELKQHFVSFEVVIDHGG